MSRMRLPIVTPGSAQHIEPLSSKRLAAVKRFRMAKGTDASRLQIVSDGCEHRLAPDKPENQSNRRVTTRDLGGGPH